MNKIPALCLSIVVFALVFALWKARAENLLMIGSIKANNELIRSLSAENAGLKLDIAKLKKPENPRPASIITPPRNEMEAILEPEGSENSEKTDNLKKRYEDILVIYFMLKKCQRNQPADYHIIISALAQEMASINAPGRLQHDVLTSAQGSYKELYEASPCTAETIEPLKEKYQLFINSVAEQFLP